MPSMQLVAECQRSAHFWRSWLERGDSLEPEAKAVFEDTVLVGRLTHPLEHFEKGDAALTPEKPLPERAQALAKRASDDLGVTLRSAENLMRLYADERLGSYYVLHHHGSVYDLLDLSVEEKIVGELSVLYHSEQCEILEIIKCILRIAQECDHPYKDFCESMADCFFTPCAFPSALWKLYLKVSTRSLPFESVSDNDVRNYVREVLDLQLRILECFVMLHQIEAYHTRLSHSQEFLDGFHRDFYEMVHLFYQQHFLGYFYDVAGSREAPHPWLLVDEHISAQAKCVGDMCLTVLLAILKPEKLHDDALGLSAAKHHLLFRDQPATNQLHEFFRKKWVDKCEVAVDPRATPSGVNLHFAQLASLVLLGWAAALAAETMRIGAIFKFSLDRIVNSVVFRSHHCHLVEDAVANILRRGYLSQHTPLCEHGAVRSVLRSFVRAVAGSFRLDRLMPGILNAMGGLLHSAHADKAVLSESFSGSYLLVYSYFQTFPLSILEKLGAMHVTADATKDHSPCALICKAMDHVLLPYEPSLYRTRSCCDDELVSDPMQVVLLEPLYVEEMALRSFGLVMPEWHVSLSVVMRPGTKGEMQDSASDGSFTFASGSRSRKVCWKLPSPCISIWRVVLVAWDAALESLGFTKPITTCVAGCDSAAGKMLPAAVRCVSELLVSCPEALFELSAHLPQDECHARVITYNGIVARLLASFHACAGLGNSESSTLPLILRALGACARAQAKAANIPPYAVLLYFFNGGSSHRFSHGDAKMFITVLSAHLEREREEGVYPATLAALIFFEDFLRSCSAEMFVLPACAHVAVPFLDGDEDCNQGIPKAFPTSYEQVSRGVETLGMFTDFVFGLCFARCHFWSCRSSNDRYQLVLACLRIASALLPCLDCFNWSTSFDAASTSGTDQGAASAHLKEALQQLRALQYRVQRSWSDSSFVHNLLHWICCDMAFGTVGGDASKHSIGLRAPVMEASFQADFVMPHPGEMFDMMEPVSGGKIVIGSLACLHGLLSLVLRPGGIAPEFADLARHLLAVSSSREPLGTQPVAGVFGKAQTTLASQRADLVQSLYAYCFAQDSIVAAWAARVMTALCGLWKHRELHSSLGRGSGESPSISHEPKLLAFLSVPSRSTEGGVAPAGSGDGGSNAMPTFLSSHLVGKLVDVLRECQDVTLRCAVANLIRVLLKTQPGLLDENYSLKVIGATTQALEDIIREMCATSPADAGGLAHLLSVVMGLLDNLASTMSDAMFAKCFASTAESGKQTSTMWIQLKSLVSDVVLPWADGRGFLPPGPGGVSSRLMPSCMLAVAAVFRVASRGCAVSSDLATQNQAAHAALLELVNILLGTAGLQLWFQSGQNTPTSDANYNVMAHPYGCCSESTFRSAPWNMLQDSRASKEHFDSLLARYELKACQLGATSDCAQSPIVDAAESFSSFSSGTSSTGCTGALLQTYGGRCSIPASFRWWSDVCLLACGSAVDISSSAQLPLPIWQPPLFNEDIGISSVNLGSWSWDAHFVGTPCSVHGPSVRWAAAHILARGNSTSEVYIDLRNLVNECSTLPIIQAGFFARVLAMDSFHELVVTSGRAQRQKASQLGTEVAKPLKDLMSILVHRLYGSLQHLDLLSDYAAFFARLMRLVTHLLAMPSRVLSIAPSLDLQTPFSRQDESASDLQGMLHHETPVGLALLRQLGAALHICTLRLHSRDDILPPRTSSLTSGATFYKGHADVVVALVSLLMLLVPALRPTSRGSSFEATTLLADLLQVLADLVDCLKEGDNHEVVVSAEALLKNKGLPTSVRFGESPPGVAGPAGRYVATSHLASSEKLNGAVLLQSSEDALARTATATQIRALDHLLRSGTSALVLRLVERVVTTLREREESRRDDQQCPSLGLKVCSVLRGAMLPRLLNWAFLQEPLHKQGSGWRLGVHVPLAIGERPDVTAMIWDRAVEAAWACRLESVFSVLFAIAQTPSGAVMLAEQRIFALLASCQLFQYAVLPDGASGQFPAAYAWPRNLQRQRVGDAAPWRRPLHESWCRALVLVATLLSSAPQLLSESTVFLQRFAPRFRYLFRSGVQSGQLAMLEEATVSCRVLSLMSHRCGLAETLLADAASQSLIFIVRTCLTDVSSPLEVFAPVSAVERISARLETESEMVPAEVPSIFHQRIQFLALTLSRNVLLALLRVVSTSVWRNNAAAWVSSSPWISSAPADAPKGWSTMPSVLGLRARSRGSLGVGNSDEQAGPQRLWAAVMDIALEGAQKFVGMLESLKKKGRAFPLLSVSAQAKTLIPLSLAIAPLGEEKSDAVASGSTSPSPFQLKSPLHSPHHHPGGNVPGSPGLGTKRKSEKRSPRRFECMVLRPDSWVGGQASAGIVPAYTQLDELQTLCSTNLEMACTLLCHYCQATVSSIRDRSAPAVTVLHGLLSFLHEMRAGPLFCDDCDDEHWLAKLDAALRASQQLETDSGMPSFAQGRLESGSGDEFELLLR